MSHTSQGRNAAAASGQIGIDFHLFNAKLTAELYTFSEPGAFATVDLIAPGEHKIKLFFHDTQYARALAYAINAAGSEPNAPIYTKTVHTENQL